MQLSEAIYLLRSGAAAPDQVLAPLLEARRKSEPPLDPDLAQQVKRHGRLLTLSHLVPIATGAAHYAAPLAVALATPAAPLVLGSALPAVVGSIGSALRYPLSRESYRAQKTHAHRIQAARDAMRAAAKLRAAEDRQKAEHEALAQAAFGTYVATRGGLDHHQDT